MIKIGDPIRLEPLDGSARQYRSKVLAVDGGAVHIGHPVDEQTGKTVYLLNGMQFKASFVSQEGTLYMFDTEVKGKVRDPLPMVVLDYRGDEYVIRIQRRRYVRVKANVDAAVHPLDGEFAPFVTMTADISAGGAALLIPPTHAPLLRPGMSVELWLVLTMRSGDCHYVRTKATVVRMAVDEHSGARMSVEFAGLAPQDRVRLIRYSFERQLEEKRRE
ncbi:flagellar brake domain-containing protein [Anoxybacillus geothermalis]|nr:flagellar brake domain-containing protein [Anoxybacillus geothermalis]